MIIGYPTTMVCIGLIYTMASHEYAEFEYIRVYSNAFDIQMSWFKPHQLVIYKGFVLNVFKNKIIVIMSKTLWENEGKEEMKKEGAKQSCARVLVWFDQRDIWFDQPRDARVLGQTAKLWLLA